MGNIIAKLFALLLFTATFVGTGVSVGSCSPEGLVDTSFSLYYPGITDIGPSTSFNLTPTWHGGTPSGFEIYRITLDGELFESESFSVDAERGEVYLRNTENLPIGKYAISIACTMDGRRYEFADIITVNMMKPVPEGISMEPSRLEIKYADMIGAESETYLATSRVTTDGEHISIKRYVIANVRKDGKPVTDYGEFFSLSETTGVFTVSKSEKCLPGEYVIDLRLTTYVIDEGADEGLFENALTVDVTSGPLALAYSPAKGKVEVGYGFESAVPAINGSRSGLVYMLRNVSPEDAPIDIDPHSGVIKVASDHTMEIGTICKVGVTATNKYGSADFDDIYSIEVVAYINPVSDFSYSDVEVMQMVKFGNPVASITGDDVVYEFVDLPETLSCLTIDSETGTISAPKGHDIPIGEYTVNVRAKNVKNEQTTSFKISVVENPYFFTYVRWGNNLGLEPASDYADQYKVTGAMTIPVAATDIKDGTEAEFSVKGGSSATGISIDERTGEITVDPSALSDKKRMGVHFTFVTVTTGAGTAAEVSIRFPIFFNYYDYFNTTDIKVDYIPFAFQCNPRTGGVSAPPTISGGTGFDRSKFTMDYRRSFQYYNFNGPKEHLNGQPSAAGSFMNTLWKAFGEAANWPVNTGARAPMSAWDNKGNTSLSPCYVRKDDLAIVVNPGKWRDDNGYANGIFIGQITYATTGIDPAGGTQIFPIAVWFDTDFVNE